MHELSPAESDHTHPQTRHTEECRISEEPVTTVCSGGTHASLKQRPARFYRSTQKLQWRWNNSSTLTRQLVLNWIGYAPILRWDAKQMPTTTSLCRIITHLVKSRRRGGIRSLLSQLESGGRRTDARHVSARGRGRRALPVPHPVVRGSAPGDMPSQHKPAPHGKIPRLLRRKRHAGSRSQPEV